MPNLEPLRIKKCTNKQLKYLRKLSIHMDLCDKYRKDDGDRVLRRYVQELLDSKEYFVIDSLYYNGEFKKYSESYGFKYKP